MIVGVRQCRVDVRGGAYGIPDGWPAMCACRQPGRAIALSAPIGGAYIINCHLNQQIEIVAAASHPQLKVRSNLDRKMLSGEQTMLLGR